MHPSLQKALSSLIRGENISRCTTYEVEHNPAPQLPFTTTPCRVTNAPPEPYKGEIVLGWTSREEPSVVCSPKEELASAQDGCWIELGGCHDGRQLLFLDLKPTLRPVAAL